MGNASSNVQKSNTGRNPGQKRRVPTSGSSSIILRTVLFPNDVNAWYRLGVVKLEGSCGIERSIEEGIMHLEYANGCGHPKAPRKLGCFYLAGPNGEPRDLSKAFNCFVIAAERGDAEANYHLACMYQKGQPVDADLEQAATFLVIAFGRGYDQAGFAYAECLENGLGVDRDTDKANFYRQEAKKRAAMKREQVAALKCNEDAPAPPAAIPAENGDDDNQERSAPNVRQDPYGLRLDSQYCGFRRNRQRIDVDETIHHDGRLEEEVVAEIGLGPTDWASRRVRQRTDMD